MNEIQDIQNLYNEVREIIASARQNAVRSVDFCRVQMYWNIGQRIFETEQQGKERAEYGSYLLKNLAKRLEPEYGSGFSVRQLELCRQFYRIYPIANTLYSQLNWSQYKLLISISDEDKRAYYQLEAVNHCWTKRELERQINSQLYERLLLSNDKESVLAVARKERIPQQPQEIIKDPMVLEFLGLEYRQMALFLQGKISGEEMFDTLLAKIRQFAKRQDSWFRKLERDGFPIYWLKPEEVPQAAELTGLFLNNGKDALPPVSFRLSNVNYGIR